MIQFEIFIAIIMASLACTGLHEITREGMIVGFVERFWSIQAHEWKQPIRFMDEPADVDRELLATRGQKFMDLISKPLSECPPCMASIWGTTFLLLFGAPFDWVLIPAVLAVAACNLVLGKLIDG